MEKNTEHGKETGLIWGFVRKDCSVGAKKSQHSPRVLILGLG